MLTTDELSLNEYIFKSSPESCSDRSYSTDFMDVTSDEDFLTQLSLDLDIPLYLNPGEDELSLLNSHFDKSPQEILSEIASPPYIMEDYTTEDSDIKNTEFTNSYNSTAVSTNYQSNKKSETSSEKSVSTVETEPLIKEEMKIITPPLSPTSVVVNTSGINNYSNNVLYKQPLKISTFHCGNLSTVPSKQIPIVPKTPISLSANSKNVVMLNTDIKPLITSQTRKLLVVENVNLSETISQMKVEPVTTSVNVIPNVKFNTVNRFSASSAIDPRILKKQQRKIKNRESASLSRKRKKDYMTSLEEKVKELSAENQRLQGENEKLKKKLAQYEQLEVTQIKKKVIKPSIFLCMVLLVVGVNFDIIRNPLRPKNQFSIIKSDIPKIMDHHGRNLLWATDEIDSNKTNSFSPFTMCPAAINQTESARLVLELERWIGKPREIPKESVINQNVTTDTRKKKKKLKIDSTLTSVYRRHRFRNGYQESLSPTKTAIQVFSTNPELYSEFFEAINRQDDTFYVVAFTDQHMLLPALYHNKTRRPKMSLIMPSVVSNGSVPQGSMIPLMQIDCEVLDTRLIHVKHGSIPKHLRAYTNITKEETSENTNIPKYYKKSYKPYFINKREIKPNKDFFNVNFN